MKIVSQETTLHQTVGVSLLNLTHFPSPIFQLLHTGYRKYQNSWFLFNVFPLLGIIKLAESCVKLQTVSLRRCVKLNDDAVVALATHCPYLTNLNFGGCYQLTDMSLSILASNSHYLESLNVSHTQVLVLYARTSIQWCNYIIKTLTILLHWPSFQNSIRPL